MMNSPHTHQATSSENYKGLDGHVESEIEVLREKMHTCVTFKVFYLIFTSIVLFSIYYIPWSYFKMIKLWTDERQLMYLILANILFLTLLILLNTISFPENGPSVSLYVYLSVLTLYLAFKTSGVVMNSYFLVFVNSNAYFKSNSVFFNKFWKQNYKTIPYTLEKDFGCCQNEAGKGACTFFNYSKEISCIQTVKKGFTIGLIVSIVLGITITILVIRELYLYKRFLKEGEFLSS